MHRSAATTALYINSFIAPNLQELVRLYRLVQEELTNAYRHASGKGQTVDVSWDGECLGVEISDQGPGFDTNHVTDWSQHLGLAGMRERVSWRQLYG